MALSPNVVVVAPSELITAAHLNNIRANLDRLDTTKLALAGGTMTGTVTFGGLPSLDVPGAQLRVDGVLSSSVTPASGAIFNTANLALNRFGAGPSDLGGVFVSFKRGWATQTGSITIGPSSGNNVAYNTSSDERLKDVVGPVVDAADRLAGLHPVRFAWKDTGNEQDGFLAHEVATVVPDAVTGERGAVLPADDPFDPGGIVPQQLDRSALIPLLVAAVQELTQRVAQLEAQSAGAM